MPRNKRTRTSSRVEIAPKASQHNYNPPFKLKDAAHRPGQSVSDFNLRHKAIGFVPQSISTNTREPPKAEQGILSNNHDDNASIGKLRMEGESSDLSEPTQDNLEKPVKALGGPLIRNEAGSSLIRQISISSGSSEEVILFEGRNPAHNNDSNRGATLPAYNIPFRANETGQKTSTCIGDLQPETLSPRPRKSSGNSDVERLATVDSVGKSLARIMPSEQELVSMMVNNDVIDRKIFADDAADDYIANLYEHDLVDNSFPRDDESEGSGACEYDLTESDGRYKDACDEQHSPEHSFNETSDEQLTYGFSKEDKADKDSAKPVLIESETDEDSRDNIAKRELDIHGLDSFVAASKTHYSPQRTHVRNQLCGHSRAIRGFSALSFEEDIKFDGYVCGETDLEAQGKQNVSEEFIENRFPTADFSISDIELEETLQNAWNKDRIKKRARKLEREELRASGSLGRKSKAKEQHARMAQSNALTAKEIGQAMEEFLTGEEESIALPPMDKGYRKAVHEIAHAFNLNSSSRGSGRNRFPVLYRTRRTVDFDENSLGRLESQLRRYLYRFDSTTKSSHFTRSLAETRTRAPSHVGYMDGEIVGSAAPELGTDNRGRAILEKMGWSRGTALGAINNKGILQPVAHVVKRSRAGLG